MRQPPNVTGGFDTIYMTDTGDYAVLIGGSGYNVYNDDAGDNVNLTANTGAIVTGAGGTIGLLGDNDILTTSNETVKTLANDQNEWITGTGDTIYQAANTSIAVTGGFDKVYMTGTGDYAVLIGGSGDVVYNDNAGDNVNLTASTSATVTGAGGTMGSPHDLFKIVR